MLVENIMKRAESETSEGITVEMIPALKSAVVSFKTAKECSEFVLLGPQNRTFKSKSLTVRALDQTKQLLLEESGLDEELLRLLFEKEGAELDQAEVQVQKQRTVLTFTRETDVLRLLQKPLQLRKKTLKLYPFYQSLGRALYGADKPPVKLPAPLLQSTDPALIRFFSKRPSVLQSLRSQLKTHWCQAELNQDCVSLSPEPELLHQEEEVLGDWTETVRSILSQFTSQFEVCKLSPPPDLWRESLENVSALITNRDQVLMVPDETNGVVKVVGLKSDVGKLKEPLCESINSLIKRARREKTQVIEEIKVSRSIFSLIYDDVFQIELLRNYPEINIDTQGAFPKVTGLKEETAAINAKVFEKKSELTKNGVDLDRHVLEFLKGGDQEQLTNVLLTGKKAVLEISGNRITLWACSEKDFKDAEAHLKSVLVSKQVEVEDSNVLQTIEWQSLVDEMENQENKAMKKVEIQTENDQVVVSGFKDIATKVSLELDYFLKQNARIQVSVAVDPIAKLEYLKRFSKPTLDALKDKVQVTFTNNGLSLSGARANVDENKRLVKEMVDSVAFESHTIAKHGARKIFDDKDENYQSIIETKTGCLVKIVDAADATRDVSVAASLLPKPDYQIKTPSGVEILVSNADMCSYPVEAIVNPTVDDLQMTQGLSAALVKAAGHQLQVECDKITLNHGNLKAGECVVTGAGGSLRCKKIIHAVGPSYDKQNPTKAQGQLKRVVKKCLELAEGHRCESVAIPAISRNRNFPLKECVKIIVRAVKEHCEDRYDDCLLKSVHFVNNDDAAVRATEDRVRQEFGNKGVSSRIPPALVLPKLASAASVSASAPVTIGTNCVGKELTKEGVEICILKGNLERATTDVIVNTASSDLNLSVGAVSCAILNAAGPALQAMVQDTQSQAAVGDVVITEGANLNCQQVFHAVAPHYDKGQGTAQKQLSDLFRDCLSTAESKGMTSISFSAMGTGNLGFPKDLVFSLLMEKVLEISSKKPKSLKKVQVVLFPGDADTIRVFSDEFQKKFPKAGGSSSTAAAASSGVSGPFSKVVSTSSTHEAKMGGVSVQVVTGDITKEVTDVIVNSTNENFSLKSGVSKAILDAAGAAVENECATLGAQANSGLILTQPGNLKCKKILHLVGKTDLTKITASVRDALLTCIKHSLSSVSFPAIGTGQGNVRAKGVADAMLDAVIDVLSKNPNSSLKSVRFVIFQTQMLKDFHDSLLQRSASDTSPKDKPKESGIIGTITSRIKSFFGPSSPEKTQTTGDFVREALKPTPVCFHICGESPTTINSAKQRIDSILSKSLSDTCLKDEIILSLSQEDYKRLEDIQRKMEVGIRVEVKNEEGRIYIEGLAKDVSVVITQIHELLKTTRLEEDLNQKAELLSAVVEWQYAAPGQDFKTFDPKTNYELEKALEKNQKDVKVKLNGQDVTVKLPRGPATCKNGQSLNIQRINKMSDLPESWDSMDTSSTKVITLAPGSTEYTTVEQLFKASCNRNVTKIERIQNPVLWQSLQIKKRAMDQKNGHSNNERRLFHGTSDDTVAFINEHGFNRSYAGKNATAFGKGTYFAVNAQYSSSDTYSRPNANGEKLMYLCSVLTGDFTVGNSAMIEPPLKQSGSIEKYDSVVDNTTRPSMFIIFHDSQAYPEYLITFT
ncbi:hypothetical protein WMY93_002209 [Mugilogobius chulae]|uniref:Poly [ADP-ribose] polymerase n=1 Tax=Mugilogobius chulae TaxID=88201 RepID=A0AAW0PSW4_9GOBI